jgi:hypothetical protein
MQLRSNIALKVADMQLQKSCLQVAKLRLQAERKVAHANLYLRHCWFAIHGVSDTDHENLHGKGSKSTEWSYTILVCPQKFWQEKVSKYES